MNYEYHLIVVDVFTGRLQDSGWMDVIDVIDVDVWNVDDHYGVSFFSVVDFSCHLGLFALTTDGADGPLLPNFLSMINFIVSFIGNAESRRFFSISFQFITIEISIISEPYLELSALIGVLISVI